MARRSEETGPTVGAAAEGVGAIGAVLPLFAVAPNRFASQWRFHPAQVAGTAKGVGITSCSASEWPAELDGGPGGSDAPVDFREGSDAKSSA